MNFVKEILTPLRVLKQKSIYNIANIRGAAVGNRKILVIESDDWGSIRVPSKMVHDKLNRVGANLDVDPFTKYDGLERVEDLQKLFSVLKQYVDCKGNHPIVTPFYVMRNADFSAILNCEYRKFYDESFLCTYKKYGEDPEMVLKTIRKGINDRVFIPELHCLEHLNVYAWMRDLQNGNEDTRLACKNGMYGLGTNFRDDNLYGYMDAFHNRYEEQIKEYECMIKTAVCDFESIMGYSPVAFTAPCYIWDPKIEEYLYTNGLMYLCGANYQLIPIAPHYEERYASGMEYNRRILRKNKGAVGYRLYMLRFKVRSAIGHMFPARKHLREMYPRAGTHNVMVPFLYLAQIISFPIKKVCSGALKRDIPSDSKHLSSETQKRVDMFQKLDML